MSKCQLCKTDEALWAAQDLPGNDGLSFTLLGSHYRGYLVTKVCDECKNGLILGPRTIGLVGGTMVRYDHGRSRWAVRPAGSALWIGLEPSVLKTIGIKDDTPRFGWLDLFGRWAACVTNGVVTDIKPVVVR